MSGRDRGIKRQSMQTGATNLLVGGLEQLLFSHILGIIIPIDFPIFQRGSNHQPDQVGLVFINFVMNKCFFVGIVENDYIGN